MSTDRTAIEVHALRVVAERTGRTILHGLDLAVPAGSIMGIVGESGSGKTTLLRCLIGAPAAGLSTTGSVELVDTHVRTGLLDAGTRALRSIRSERIAYLAQDPGRSLTPTMRIGSAIAERLPQGLDRGTRDQAVRALLGSVGLPTDDDFVGRHPFALSGGQAQRVALARALATSPDVLLLDEPTTGLDVVTQAELLDELRRQHELAPRTTVIVSHDLAVIAHLADHVMVLRHGAIVEQGPALATLASPAEPYTRQLVDACPDPLRADRPDRPVIDRSSRSTATDREVALRITGLRATHQRPRRSPVVAAHDLDLELRAGSCIALVGSSGSGKSTIVRSIVGAHVPDAGEIMLDERPLSGTLSGRTDQERWSLQLVPQDPTSSLDPRRRVGRSVADVVRRCRPADAPALDRDGVDHEVVELFTRVDLDPMLRHRRPGALSGGERQRVAIARALAADPRVLICDEVTSALDVSVQAGVIRLLRSLVDEHGLAMIFVTHDLGLIHDVADEVAVLHDGHVCEIGPVDSVIRDPQHQQTQRLLAASPSLSAELAAIDPAS